LGGNCRRSGGTWFQPAIGAAPVAIQNVAVVALLVEIDYAVSTGWNPLASSVTRNPVWRIAILTAVLIEVAITADSSDPHAEAV
jgi:hypothetical protein